MELFGYPILNIAIAVTIGYFFWRTGFRILRGMAAPIPEPPPPGELRKVKIMYRCGICATVMRTSVPQIPHRYMILTLRSSPGGGGSGIGAAMPRRIRNLVRQKKLSLIHI